MKVLVRKILIMAFAPLSLASCSARITIEDLPGEYARGTDDKIYTQEIKLQDNFNYVYTIRRGQDVVSSTVGKYRVFDGTESNVNSISLNVFIPGGEIGKELGYNITGEIEEVFLVMRINGRTVLALDEFDDRYLERSH